MIISRAFSEDVIKVLFPFHQLIFADGNSIAIMTRKLPDYLKNNLDMKHKKDMNASRTFL